MLNKTLIVLAKTQPIDLLDENAALKAIRAMASGVPWWVWVAVPIVVMVTVATKIKGG